jgi:5-methyltetrahydrofolate--homocysteine methyltransferase
MMKTVISKEGHEVSIGDNGPTVLIGERINPTGRKRLVESLKAGDLSVVRELALSQVKDGAAILDVNVVAPGINERDVLPRAVEALMAVVDVPLCIDVNHREALKGALEVYRGKPIVNSVTGEEKSLNAVLPLVREYGTAVIGLTLDEKGIPKEAEKRVEIAAKIIERARSFGIPAEDVIIDCLSLTVGADGQAGLLTLEAVRRVQETLGVNQTLGASNISFGLPNRMLLNQVFLSMAIQAGVTCPTVNPAKVCTAALAADLILGRDRFAMRFIKDYQAKQGIEL